MAFTDFYRQARWIKLRKGLMFERLNAEGLLLCEHCGKPILKDYDAILHHKIELTPQVTNGGTAQAVVLNFVIPKGDKGDKGDTGNKGDDGKTPSFSVNANGELIATFE